VVDASSGGECAFLRAGIARARQLDAVRWHSVYWRRAGQAIHCAYAPNGRAVWPKVACCRGRSGKVGSTHASGNPAGRACLLACLLTVRTTHGPLKWIMTNCARVMDSSLLLCFLRKFARLEGRVSPTSTTPPFRGKSAVCAPCGVRPYCMPRHPPPKSPRRGRHRLA
jgi:hypothetical protein